MTETAKMIELCNKYIIHNGIAPDTILCDRDTMLLLAYDLGFKPQDVTKLRGMNVIVTIKPMLKVAVLGEFNEI